MRYERKYRVEASDLGWLQQVLRLHPAGFRTLYPDRQVNNIYYDTAHLTTYEDNVKGISDRKKFRIRWYGDDFTKVAEPKLEVKIKQNQLGGKEISLLDQFDLDQLSTATRQLNQKIRYGQALQPILANAYRRSYYGTTNGLFRVTIDHGVKYFSFLNAVRFSRFLMEDPALIVELKFDEELEERSQEIMQYLPFRQTKSSKYVSGVYLTNG